MMAILWVRWAKYMRLKAVNTCPVHPDQLSRLYNEDMVSTHAHSSVSQRGCRRRRTRASSHVR